jgi:hypothetical protein
MVRNDFVALPRDDQGPPLYVRKPDSRIASLDEHGPSHTDENGFCNAAGQYSAHERLDLVAVGDSFTWCHAVRTEQAWVARLAERSGLATYNLGRGGSGPYEYLQVLQHYGLPKHPRIVVLNIYEGNDLRDAMLYWRYRHELERSGHPPATEPVSAFPALTNSPLGRHSYVANVVLAFLTRVLERRDPDVAEENAVDFEYSLEFGERRVPFNLENRDTDEVIHARRLADGRESLELWDGALTRFAELAREHGFSPVLSYIPSAHTSYAERTRFTDPSLAPLLAAFSRTQREFLAQRAASLGFAFCDFTPALVDAARASGPGTLLYDPKHIHLTPAGHEVVAGVLSAFLRERGLVPLR